MTSALTQPLEGSACTASMALRAVTASRLGCGILSMHAHCRLLTRRTQQVPCVELTHPKQACREVVGSLGQCYGELCQQALQHTHADSSQQGKGQDVSLKQAPDKPAHTSTKRSPCLLWLEHVTCSNGWCSRHYAGSRNGRRIGKKTSMNTDFARQCGHPAIPCLRQARAHHCTTLQQHAPITWSVTYLRGTQGASNLSLCAQAGQHIVGVCLAPHEDQQECTSQHADASERHKHAAPAKGLCQCTTHWKTQYLEYRGFTQQYIACWGVEALNQGYKSSSSDVS
jgi:hypothetical protein